MDTSPAVQSPEVSEPRPAFRKPSNDTSRRHYRRHSPSTSRSPSPPSTGGRKRDRSPLSLNSQEDGRSKMADSAKRGRRFETGREVDRGFESTRGGRADGVYYDRRSEIQNHDRYRSDECNYKRSYSNYYDRSYRSHTTNSSRVLYANTRPDYCRGDEYGRRSQRQRGYDDYGRSAREPERSHRECGNDDIMDKDELRREKARSREKDNNADKDGYKDQEGSLERDQLGGSYYDVNADAVLSREKGRDRRRYKDRDERSRERDKVKDVINDYERYRDRDDRYERDRHKERDDHHERDRHKERDDRHERDRHKDRDDRHERDRRRDRDESKEHDWHKDRHETKQQDRYRIKENFKEPARSKEKEKERETARDKDDYIYRDSHRRKNNNDQDQKSGHHYDTVKDGSQPRERGQPGEDSGEIKASYEKYHGDSSARETQRPAHGTSEGTSRTGNDSIDKECKKLDLFTSDTHAKSRERATSASQEAGEETDSHDADSQADGKSGENTEWGPEGRTQNAASEEEVANDLNVARIAAMRAAELVNKNLGGGGFLSADQKKKLLWGSKKNVADQPQETATGNNRWDMARFADPDRQEKFNKLMGVKGDYKVDQQSGEKDSGLFATEKQMELQQDLEKQFTAGMRRRDGRTVGLGL